VQIEQRLVQRQLFRTRLARSAFFDHTINLYLS
jgi:hypothetical protein